MNKLNGLDPPANGPARKWLVNGLTPHPPWLVKGKALKHRGLEKLQNEPVWVTFGRPACVRVLGPGEWASVDMGPIRLADTMSNQNRTLCAV